MNHGMDGFAHLLFKTLLKIGARDPDRIEYLIHFNPFTGVITNVMHGLNNGGIGQRAVIC